MDFLIGQAMVDIESFKALVGKKIKTAAMYYETVVR